MTENKRFYLNETGINDREYEFGLLGEDELVDIINELNDENKRLKLEYKVLHTQHQDLRNFVENNFNDYVTREKLHRQIIELSDENEQLRQEVETLQEELAHFLGDVE